MRKAPRWLMLIGSLVMSASLFLKHLFTMPDSMAGFIAGLGIGLMLVSVACMARQKRMSRRMQSQNAEY